MTAESTIRAGTPIFPTQALNGGYFRPASTALILNVQNACERFSISKLRNSDCDASHEPDGQVDERETVKAELRANVKNLLRQYRYHYPPDRQEAATTTVLRQADILCAEWAGE